MSDYIEVETLEDGGVSCVVTKRTSNLGIKQYSFKFFRTYVQAGEGKSTIWLNPRHIDAIMRLASRVDDIIGIDKAAA